MAALRYLQKQITQENYRNEIDRVVSKVYANKNSNVITPLSLLETDAMLAYLFEYVLKEKSTLYTQNILYLFAYLNQNISFWTWNGQWNLNGSHLWGSRQRTWWKQMLKSSWKRSEQGLFWRRTWLNSHWLEWERSGFKCWRNYEDSHRPNSRKHLRSSSRRSERSVFSKDLWDMSWWSWLFVGRNLLSIAKERKWRSQTRME